MATLTELIAHGSGTHWAFPGATGNIRASTIVRTDHVDTGIDSLADAGSDLANVESETIAMPVSGKLMPVRGVRYSLDGASQSTRVTNFGFSEADPPTVEAWKMARGGHGYRHFRYYSTPGKLDSDDRPDVRLVTSNTTGGIIFGAVIGPPYGWEVPTQTWVIPTVLSTDPRTAALESYAGAVNLTTIELQNLTTPAGTGGVGASYLFAPYELRFHRAEVHPIETNSGIRYAVNYLLESVRGGWMQEYLWASAAEVGFPNLIGSPQPVYGDNVFAPRYIGKVLMGNGRKNLAGILPVHTV